MTKLTTEAVADKIEKILLNDTEIIRTKCQGAFIGIDDIDGDIETLAEELIQKVITHTETYYDDAKSIEYLPLPVYIKEYDKEGSSRRIIEDSDLGVPFYYTIWEQDEEDSWYFQVCLNVKIILP